ncbi:MAG: chemotaxis protein MotB, partial [Desulfovibrio sp.]|nr:chemotaxis protein MotB [Desulfovibrio sp.]
MLKLSDLRKPRDDGEEYWQLSLADMMTLILCFFVVIVSVSRLDVTRYEKVAGVMEKAMTRERRKEPAAKVPSPPETTRAAQPVRDQAHKPEPAQPEVRAQAAPPPPPKDIEQFRSEILAKLAGKTEQVEVIHSGDTLALTLRDTAFFDLASAEIKPASLPLLSDIAESL